MKTNLKGLNELAKRIYDINVEKGFYDDQDNPLKFQERISLIHSEVSEALEAHRKDRWANKNIDVELEHIDLMELSDSENVDAFKENFLESIKDTVEDEMADVFIRLLDMAAAYEVDLERHVELKLNYNLTRGFKHGKKY